MADAKISALTTGIPVRADKVPYADTVGGVLTKTATFTDIVDKAVKMAGSAPAQTPAANTDTYITGSTIDIAGRLQVGSILKWKIVVTKTAAGAAAPVWNVRFGTAATTSDTSRLALTGATQTAAIDHGVFEVALVVTTASATGVCSGFVMLMHNLGATGLGGAGTNAAFRATSAAFDMTVASLKAGLSVNTGASAAWTINQVFTEAYNLV